MDLDVCIEVWIRIQCIQVFRTQCRVKTNALVYLPVNLFDRWNDWGREWKNSPKVLEKKQNRVIFIYLFIFSVILCDSHVRIDLTSLQKCMSSRTRSEHLEIRWRWFITPVRSSYLTTVWTWSLFGFKKLHVGLYAIKMCRMKSGGQPYVCVCVCYSAMTPWTVFRAAHPQFGIPSGAAVA